MTRQVFILPNGETIHYQLERRPRRTIGLKITSEGLFVHAPKRIADWQLQQVLLEKAPWILKKLEAREANQVPEVQWQDGEKLLFLGSEISLNIKASPTSRAIVFEQNTLNISLPEPSNHGLIRRKVVQWYKKQAMPDFTRRLEIFAAKLGVPTPKLMLSNAQSRWGSCNSRGEVRLNWRLMQAPPQLINYVICHELAHLKQMNHSAKFWAVVAILFPDYKNAEKELKQWSPRLHAIDA